MQANNLGYIEMAFVFALCIGWSLYELWSLRRDDKTKVPKPPENKPPM